MNRKWYPDNSVSTSKVLAKLPTYSTNLTTFIENYVTSILTKHEKSEF